MDRDSLGRLSNWTMRAELYVDCGQLGSRKWGDTFFRYLPSILE